MARMLIIFVLYKLKPVTYLIRASTNNQYKLDNFSQYMFFFSGAEKTIKTV